LGDFRVLVVPLPPSLGGGYMVIAADEEAVGAQASDPEGGVRIVVPPRLSSEGDTVNAEDLARLLGDPRVTTVLLYGRRSVQLAVDMGLASEEAILEVNGLRHAIVYKFQHGI